MIRGLGLGDTQYQSFLLASWDDRGLGIEFNHIANDLIHHTCVIKSPQTLDTEAWRSLEKLGEAFWMGHTMMHRAGEAF